MTMYYIVPALPCWTLLMHRYCYNFNYNHNHTSLFIFWTLFLYFIIMLVFAKLVNGLSKRRRKINSWRCKDRSAGAVTRVTIVLVAGRCHSLGWPTAGESSQQSLPGPNNKPQFVRPKRKERKKKKKKC